jgi:diguanylate cyclase (GGDEF)-like protein/PAS domain S-box-containing protein
MATLPNLPQSGESLNCQALLEYQALLSNATLGIAVTRHRTFLHCNERWGDMFGWPCDELAGQPTLVVYPSPEAFDELSRIAIPILGSGQRLDMVLVMKRRCGSTFWCRMVGKALDPTDPNKGTIFIAEDVTDRKTAQDTARQLLLEYQAILDNASLGITFTRNRTFLHCNQRFSEMFGWRSDELVGQPAHVIYPSAQAYAALGRIAAETLGMGKRMDTELLLMKHNGTLFWCRLLANAIDPADQSKGTIFVTEDITERKAAEYSARQLLLEYQAILDNASLGINFTRNRIYVHCNERFAEMFGWTSRELIGQPTNVVFRSQDDYDALSRIAIPILGSGQRLDTELVMKRRDGSTLWCRMLAKAIDATDHSKGTVFIVEDITQRKAAQDALLQAHDELELRVKERTAELAAANTQLQQEIQERKEAEELARHLANHDALTGLPNRRWLEERLEQAIAGAKRNSHQVAVQFIDLDHFKPINDRLGHRIGDLVLQEVAARLRGLLREVDTVSRIGGDEFVVVLQNVQSGAAATEVGKKVLDALSQPYNIESHSLSITPSIGISLYPQNGMDAEALIRRADGAMYQAKQTGRAKVQLVSAADTKP